MNFKYKVYYCMIAYIAGIFSSGNGAGNIQTFDIDYTKGEFIKDGKPFRFVSGSMHYFRVPHQYWSDRMRKMRAAGLNALQTYIEWASHEPERGIYNFDHNSNIEHYLDLAKAYNLSVILRPGPFIDAERDMGGLPYWLLSVDPSIKLRTASKSYWYYVEQWFSILLPRLKKHMYHNNGPVIMIQVENEYGSYPACDRQYTILLRDMFHRYLGSETLLFSTDGNGDGYLQCGKVPGVYATVDFGAGAGIPQAFQSQLHFEISGPKVNSEFYPGWLDVWGEPHATVNKDDVTKTLDDMLAFNASVNIYVFHGGTSFGFSSGAVPSNPYKPCITSYDYDAPLNEAGDPTEKYFAIRKVISKYLPLPDIPVPKPSSKAAYGKVHLHYAADLWGILHTPLCHNIQQSNWPLTFEALQQNYGYVLYCTKLYNHFPDPSALELKGLADRAYVFVNKAFSGILSRSDSILTLPIQVTGNQSLCILTENQGRMSVGPGIKDFKGLTQNATLAGQILKNWIQYSLPFNNTDTLSKFARPHSKASGKKGILSLYTGSFLIDRSETELADSFLLLPGWSKGIVFINGINIGRYWPSQGPQITLYVPKYFLKSWPIKNWLVVVEQERSPCIGNRLGCVVEFIDFPILNGSTPSNNRRIDLFKKIA